MKDERQEPAVSHTKHCLQVHRVAAAYSKPTDTPVQAVVTLFAAAPGEGLGTDAVSHESVGGHDTPAEEKTRETD